MGQVEMRPKLRCKKQTEISKVKCKNILGVEWRTVSGRHDIPGTDKSTQKGKDRESGTENVPEAQVSEIRLK